MKTQKMKTIKILFLLAITGLLTGNTFAATIDKIDAIDNNTVQVTASSDVVFPANEVEGEVKLLKDVPVSFSAKDIVNPKKVLLNLSTDITANTSYTLITIAGAEGNIDFKIANKLEGEYLNSSYVPGEVGIEKVNVIDSRTIELYFDSALTADSFEFKILSEIQTSGIISKGNNVFDLEIAKNIEKSTSYIVMIVSLKDAKGREVKLSEDLYDLVTPANLLQSVPEQPVVVAVTLNAATTGALAETGNILEVAKQVVRTPETGAASTILIIVAFLSSLVFFFRKNFVK